MYDCITFILLVYVIIQMNGSCKCNSNRPTQILNLRQNIFHNECTRMEPDCKT